MQTPDSMSTTSPERAIFTRMVLDAWQTYSLRLKKLVNKLTDEQLMAETAPGRNTGVYLLGHLVAVHDGMFPLLGFGEKAYPALEPVFLSNPDRSGLPKPPIADLKNYLEEVDGKLAARIAQVQPAEWFAKHAAVSDEDFAREPHRNKLNIIVNRTNHLSYHLGQMAYLDKSATTE